MLYSRFIATRKLLIFILAEMRDALLLIWYTSYLNICNYLEKVFCSTDLTGQRQSWHRVWFSPNHRELNLMLPPPFYLLVYGSLSTLKTW